MYEIVFSFFILYMDLYKPLYKNSIPFYIQTPFKDIPYLSNIEQPRKFIIDVDKINDISNQILINPFEQLPGDWKPNIEYTLNGRIIINDRTYDKIPIQIKIIRGSSMIMRSQFIEICTLRFMNARTYQYSYEYHYITSGSFKVETLDRQTYSIKGNSKACFINSNIFYKAKSNISFHITKEIKDESYNLKYILPHCQYSIEFESYNNSIQKENPLSNSINQIAPIPTAYEPPSYLLDENSMDLELFNQLNEELHSNTINLKKEQDLSIIEIIPDRVPNITKTTLNFNPTTAECHLNYKFNYDHIEECYTTNLFYVRVVFIILPMFALSYEEDTIKDMLWNDNIYEKVVVYETRYKKSEYHMFDEIELSDFNDGTFIFKLPFKSTEPTLILLTIDEDRPDNQPNEFSSKIKYSCVEYDNNRSRSLPIIIFYPYMPNIELQLLKIDAINFLIYIYSSSTLVYPYKCKIILTDNEHEDRTFEINVDRRVNIILLKLDHKIYKTSCSTKNLSLNYRVQYELFKDNINNIIGCPYDSTIGGHMNITLNTVDVLHGYNKKTNSSFQRILCGSCHNDSIECKHCYKARYISCTECKLPIILSIENLPSIGFFQYTFKKKSILTVPLHLDCFPSFRINARKKIREAQQTGTKEYIIKWDRKDNESLPDRFGFIKYNRTYSDIR